MNDKEKIAIVGRSGNGKSTIFNLLLRYFDASIGDVLIDGINIKDLTEESLRNNISIIRQSPFLFNMSILDNFKTLSSPCWEHSIICEFSIWCLNCVMKWVGYILSFSFFERYVIYELDGLVDTINAFPCFSLYSKKTKSKVEIWFTLLILASIKYVDNSFEILLNIKPSKLICITKKYFIIFLKKDVKNIDFFKLY